MAKKKLTLLRKAKKATKKTDKRNLLKKSAPAPKRDSRKTARVSKESTAAALPTETILLLGDAPLVQEYGDFFATKGFSVLTTIPRDASKTSVAFELTNVSRSGKRSNLEMLDKVLPPERILISTSVTISATEQASWITHRHRLVGCGLLPSLSTRPLVELAATIYSPSEFMELAVAFFVKTGKNTEIVQDRVGLVFPRTLCRLINEAAFALTEEIAAPQDLDAAVKTALQHPYGPIEWVDRIGLDQVAAILKALEEESGDPRYRMAPLLHQMALAGEWWKR